MTDPSANGRMMTEKATRRYELGTRVEFTWHLTRRSEYDNVRHIELKLWRTETYDGQPEPAARRGIVVGIRTLSNGENRHWGYDEPIEYRQTETFAAYLIAHNLRQRPVLVLPEHVRSVDG